MKYLITGGAGFIGSHVADALIDRGDSIVVLDNLTTGNSHNIEHLVGDPQFEFVQGSVLDMSLLQKLCESVDHVLHFAAAVGVFTIVDKPLESLITNLRGTENVLEAAHQSNKPILLASTSEIYGKNGSGPLHEESDRIVGSPLKSRWSYSEAKAIDESMAYFYFSEKKLPVRILRFFNTVGPRQVGRYGMVVPRFISAALKNEPLTVYGTGSQSRCFCHVADAVAAVLMVIDSDLTLGEVFNVGNDEEITIEALALEIIKQTGSTSVIEKIEYEEAYATGFEDMQRRIPDITKIKRVLGWTPKRSLDVIIKEIADHLNDHHLNTQHPM
jgi:UDP-glucose 4-epimerase